MPSALVSTTLLPHDEKTLHLRIVPYDLPTIEKIRSLPQRRWNKVRQQKNLDPSTINTTTAAINFFYETIVSAGNAADNLPMLKTGKNLPKVPSHVDLSDMLEGVHNPKHRLVLILAYGCGLRLSEIHAIKVNAIDWDRMVLRIHGKGPKERDLPLYENVSSPLREYLADNPNQTYLFEGINKGYQYSHRTIQNIYKNACRNAGIQKRGGIHSIRHSCATNLLEQGTGIRQIQALLGHANSKTTPIYTLVSQEELGKIKSPLASLKPRKKRGAS